MGCRETRGGWGDLPLLDCCHHYCSHADCDAKAMIQGMGGNPGVKEPLRGRGGSRVQWEQQGSLGGRGGDPSGEGGLPLYPLPFLAFFVARELMIRESKEQTYRP